MVSKGRGPRDSCLEVGIESTEARCSRHWRWREKEKQKEEKRCSEEKPQVLGMVTRQSLEDGIAGQLVPEPIGMDVTGDGVDVAGWI